MELYFKTSLKLYERQYFVNTLESGVDIPTRNLLRVRVCACVRACVRACVCVCVKMQLN